MSYTSKLPKYPKTGCCMLPRGSAEWTWPPFPMKCPREATHTVFRDVTKSIDDKSTWRSCSECYDEFFKDRQASAVTPHGYDATEWDDIFDIGPMEEITMEYQMDIEAFLAGRMVEVDKSLVAGVISQLNIPTYSIEAAKIRDAQAYMAHEKRVADETRQLSNTIGDKDEEYKRWVEELRIRSANRYALGEGTNKPVAHEGKNRNPSTQSEEYQRLVTSAKEYLEEVASSTDGEVKPEGTEEYQRAVAVIERIFGTTSSSGIETHKLDTEVINFGMASMSVIETETPKSEDDYTRLVASVEDYLKEVASKIDGETPESEAASEEYEHAMAIVMRIFY
ncbi:hypothetical protein PG987_010102 [Apiospora arundinis]